jgi:ABC-type multidrug transport system ATPase subunit
MTVGELASLVAGLKAVGRREVDDMLERFGLVTERKRLVSVLSGGMQQRLALGLALLGSPALLLLDEPAASLDRKTRLELVQRLARERGRGVTLVFSSHAADDVELLSTRVIVLGEGKVVADMTSAAFMTALRNGDLP